MDKPKIEDCSNVADMLSQLSALCERFVITGIAVILSVQDGACITTHQFGMDSRELEIASELIADYARGILTEYVEQ